MVKIGLIALILDVLKGILAVYIGRLVMDEKGMLIAGVFVVIGHNWPVLLSLKVGKV